MNESNKLDLTKPVQTNTGCPARIVATDLKGYYKCTIMALVLGADGHESPYSFQADGTSNKGSSFALVNVPPQIEQRSIFVNVYPIGAAVENRVDDRAHSTRDAADRSQAQCVKRIACLEFKYAVSSEGTAS